MSRYINPVPQYFLNDGSVASSGKFYFYENKNYASLKGTFSQSDNTVENTNPLILDGQGRFPPCFGDGLYSVKFYSSTGVLQWTRDDVALSELTGQFTDWSPSKTYTVNDVVKDNIDGIYYKLFVVESKGEQPSTTPTKWEKLLFITEFNDNRVYDLYDTVSNLGKLYSSKINNNSDAPPSASWSDLSFNNAVIGDFSVTGQISSATISTSGNITTPAQISSGSISTGAATVSSLTASGAVSSATVSATGNVTSGATVSGATVSSTGGITAATSVTAATVSASGLISSSVGLSPGNVGSGSATVLDYYLEGTYTPSIAGLTAPGTATYQTQSGSYTRFGNRVLFEIILRWTGHTGTGDMLIAGAFPLSPSMPPLPVPSVLAAESFSLFINGFSYPAGAPAAYFDGALSIKLGSMTTAGTISSIPMSATGSVTITGMYRVS